MPKKAEKEKVNSGVLVDIKEAAGKAIEEIKEFAKDPEEAVENLEHSFHMFTDSLELDELADKVQAGVKERLHRIEEQIDEFSHQDAAEVVARVKYGFRDLREYVAEQV